MSDWFDQSQTRPPLTRRRTCYYAHCMSIYGKLTEARDVEALRALGFAVVNPNDQDISKRCEEIRDTVERTGYWEAGSPGPGLTFRYTDASTAIMEVIFKPLARSCDVLAFRALPDGTIPAGVAKEIQWAIEAGKTIIELPCSLKRRTLSVELTREYLREVGQR